MDSLENITTVDELLNAQSDEVIVSDAEEKVSEDEDFDKGTALLKEVRKLRPDVWLKMAEALVIDVAEFHRYAIEDLSEKGKHDKAMNWAYDTAILDLVIKQLDSIKL